MTVRPLTPALAEKARAELNEDPKRLEDGLQQLKEWISKQPHLRARTDDQWLAAFLRGCKFSLERAKQKIDLYYTVRTTAPEICRVKHTNPLFMEILQSGDFVILPKTYAADAPRVGLFRLGGLDPEKYKMTDIMSVVLEINKIVFMEDDNTIVAGVQYIMDMKGMSMGHFLQMTPMNMKKMTVAGQDAVPIRMKGVHYLNVPSGFDKLFNLFRSFLNEKNRSRLYVHGDKFEEMYKHIPKSVLPAEYGGDGGTIKEIIDYWKKKVEEYGSWLEEDCKYGTDETKRPGKPKTAEDMYGIEGSFRQLEFD